MNKADLIEAMAEKTVFTKKDSELARVCDISRNTAYKYISPS